jgi:hypothetical protein
MGATVVDVGQFDDKQQGALFRKLLRRLIPFLFLSYVVSYLDRLNVGIASLTMSHDIGLTPRALGLGFGIFAVGRHMRDSQQPDASSVWGAPLDRANHDYLGHRLRRNGTRVGRARFLCGSLPAGGGRSGLCARHLLLSDVVVSKCLARQGDGGLPRCSAHYRRRRFPYFGGAAGHGRHLGSAWLAVVVHSGGSSRNCVGVHLLDRPD